MSNTSRVKFKMSSFKLRFTYMTRIRLSLKVLRLCFRYLNKITIPTNTKECDCMIFLLGKYDEAIMELNDYVDVYRRRVDEYISDKFKED